jgi:probable addiction module antidote protein
MTLKTTPFDAAEYLTSPEAIATYLNDAIASGDADELIAALGTVARVKGMSVIARDTGLGRESLYKALSRSSNPAFATVNRVIASLGLRMAVEPARRTSRTQAGRRTASRAAARAD